ncbi:MAG: hypothetical protein K2P84_01595 [Undibacterium sp.]|nr:hypothetical protein [Undibacterium sp.]
MKTKITILIVVAILFQNTAVLAHETKIHRTLSINAVRRSVLNLDPSLLSDLGLGPYAGTLYTPIGAIPPEDMTIEKMISHGAWYEDEQYKRRAVNHFFDPQFNNFQGRGLQTLAISGFASPDWELEEAGELRDGSQAQEFSFRNGQQNYWAGLTSRYPSDRYLAFSRVFQTLGHLAHHLQDMSQPQHTRNDQHINIDPIIPPWAFYEKYTQDHEETLVAPLMPGNYPIPTFSDTRLFWHSPSSTTPQFIGMAEFTAQNYTSYGTQFVYGGKDFNGADYVLNAPGFPLPNGINRDGSKTSVERLPTAIQLANGTTINGSVECVVGSIYDALNSAFSKSRQCLAESSALNVFGVALAKSYVDSIKGFQDGYKVLLPRAVAFSAGIINHFFRGRINFRRGTSPNSWVIENPGRLLNGTFSVFADDAYGQRTQLPFAQFSTSIATNSNVSISFAEPPTGTKSLILAFRGQIGAEGDPSALSGFYAVTGKVIPYVAPSVPAVPCRGIVSETGSSAGLDVIHELGSTPGIVSVDFEPYTIPDGLQIFANNSAKTLLLSSGGLVSMSRKYTFNFDAKAYGTSQVRIKVTGNIDTRTAWDLGMGCPGQSAPRAPTVGVLFDQSDYSPFDCSGYWEVTVDGEKIVKGSIIPLSPRETHVYLVNFISPYPNTSGSCYAPIPFYKDNNGRHNMINYGLPQTFIVY